MVETITCSSPQALTDQHAFGTERDEPECPACKSRSLASLRTVSAREAAQFFAPERADAESHERIFACVTSLWGGQTCHIMSCKDCGFGFAWPFVAGNAEFYNFTGAAGVYPRSKWEFARTAAELERLNRPGAKVLEVGAGNGYFLDLICPSLVRAEDVTALEYNEKSIPILRGKGYRALSVDLRDKALDDCRASFDFIFLFQIVEHLDGLDELFGRIRSLLKAGGSAFCAVPNSARIEYQEANRSVPDLPPNHIGRWTPQAFEAVCRRNGLTARSAELEPLSWGEFLSHDISYSHIRRTQLDPDGIMARVRSLPRGRTRRLMEATLAALFIPTRLSAWRHVYRNREKLGASLWVRLDRCERPDIAEMQDAALVPAGIQDVRFEKRHSTAAA
ncbi:class I SAM-dependent methyltransferase [Bradyrhizobium sp. STM 3562]|uniref:class I SAM-dependent methyltransferase n=1 Tax=Bradyrhizobium sp. STM 3562 TaxID=578924 RepID=UPI00388D4CC2